MKNAKTEALTIACATALALVIIGIEIVAELGGRTMKFEKVSKAQYNGENYDDIQLPSRATKGSAGYDFFTPVSINIKAGEWLTIPLGVRCQMPQGLALILMPKSGLGFKYGMRLANTVGLIDSDYYYSDNEGHIMVKFTVDEDMSLKAGAKLLQGVFIPYGVTEDDECNNCRNGGFGSTGN